MQKLVGHVKHWTGMTIPEWLMAAIDRLLGKLPSVVSVFGFSPYDYKSQENNDDDDRNTR